MRAAQIHAYGGPEVFRVEEVDKPSPGRRDVLVRVRASSVNPVDWKIRSGGMRSLVRVRLPWTLGLDVSGVVEAVGEKVTRFRVGDEIWSSPTHRRPGAYAEYMCIDEREASKKPANLTHEEAASMPLVALTAWQCLVEKGHLRAGQTVLVFAGAGGVGSFAVQLAKHRGARVIATCSARNADFVRSLGADRVVDYTKENVAEALADERIDLVLDALGGDDFDTALRVVRPGGRIANIAVDVGERRARLGAVLGLVSLLFFMLRVHVWPLLAKRVVGRHVVKRSDGAQLAEIAALVEEGAIRPVIDTVLPLDAIAEAHRRSESHRARGKIVVRVAEA